MDFFGNITNILCVFLHNKAQGCLFAIIKKNHWEIFLLRRMCVNKKNKLVRINCQHKQRRNLTMPTIVKIFFCILKVFTHFYKLNNI